MSVYLGEFIGTLLLIVFGGGVVAGVVLKGTKSEGAEWLGVVVAWGLAVTLAIYAVGQISQAHINPAVTLSLAFVGEFPWAEVPGYIISQIAGALTGAVIIWIHYLPHWEKTDDKEAKLAVFATAPAERSFAANFISEMIATIFLIMGLLFIGANKFTEGLNPLVVGCLIIAIGLGLGSTTGFAINPARDLGPRIAHFLLPVKGKGHSDWSYSWIPVFGPMLGGLCGASLYKVIFEQQFHIYYVVVICISLMITAWAIVKEYKR